MDFGLAVLGGHFNGEVFAGTPAYMAPEQLAGKEVTPQSDIYALGLVLYEMFTGKRDFDDGDLAELRRKREQSRPITPSSLIKEIDPLVERVIMRCLDKDPRNRPATALQVAASLPGGDPLQAALAAGETPSPEMVAAASETGALRPPLAVAYLAAFLIGLALVAFLSDKVQLHRYVPLDKSPDVLADRASTMIKRFGYADAARDRVYGFTRNSGYLQYVGEHDHSASRWQALAAGRPWGVLFWYRQSPQRLQPSNYWDVSFNDPPLSESGMVSLMLDTEGRLVDFFCFPPMIDASSAPVSFDWSGLFAAAELDIANFKSVESQWVPPVAYDQRAAWEGVFPEQPQIPLRIEAASYRGKPVYFESIGPWTRPARLGPASGNARDKGLQFLILLIVVGCMVGGGLLARRNLRLGRGDRRGAFRLALAVFVVSILGWLFGANHVPTSTPINGIVPVAWSTPVVWALYTVTFIWVFYIALEPYLRQRWPHRIVSWSRLLAGRWRDPLVGRDLLIGGLFGMAIILINYGSFMVSKWTSAAPLVPRTINLDTLLGGRRLFGLLCHMQVESLVTGLGTMMLVLLFYLGVRREWLAVAGVWLLLAFVRILGEDATSLGQSLSIALQAVLYMIVLMRYGLLALIAAQFFTWYWNYPLTADVSTWYAGSGQFAMAIAAGLAIYGFYTCLARQPRLSRSSGMT